MTAITINPMVVALRPTNGTIVRRIQPTEHGGGVKKVLAVVVAVAIPIAAPAIASSLVASAGISAITSFAATTVGAAVTSAVVGAGLGAISAKVMGGDVKSGAIMGAIGGGIGGYGVAQQTGAGLGNVNQTGIQATANNTFGTTFGQPTAGTETAGLNTTGADAGATLTSDASGSTLADATTGEATLQNASLPGQSVADAGARLSNTAATTETAKTAMSQLGPDATFAAKSGAYLKDAGSALVSKVTDPAALASLTMQAGGQLLGAAMAPDPEMPPEQRELLEMRKAELAELKERDENAFNAQMEAAQGFLRQAEQYDPTYMAFQAANKEAIDQQRKLREQYRKSALGSGRDISEAEKRRMSLDSARNVSSRYDQGFQQGLTAQNKVTQAGLSAIPNSSNFATYTNALQSLSQDTQKAEDAAIQKAQGAGKNISDLFAGFNTTSGTGYGADSYWNSNKAKEKTKKKAGVDTSNFGTIAV